MQRKRSLKKSLGFFIKNFVTTITKCKWRARFDVVNEILWNSIYKFEFSTNLLWKCSMFERKKILWLFLFSILKGNFRTPSRSSSFYFFYKCTQTEVIKKVKFEFVFNKKVLSVIQSECSWACLKAWFKHFYMNNT